MSRYRWRTRVRSHLPWVLTRFVPKGLRDCGDHEWHREEGKTFRCYHCEPGIAYDLAAMWREAEAESRAWNQSQPVGSLFNPRPHGSESSKENC